MNFETQPTVEPQRNEEGWLNEMTSDLSDDERQEIEDLWPEMTPIQKQQAHEAFLEAKGRK